MFEALSQGFAMLVQPVPLGWLVLGVCRCVLGGAGPGVGGPSQLAMDAFDHGWVELVFRFDKPYRYRHLGTDDGHGEGCSINQANGPHIADVPVQEPERPKSMPDVRHPVSLRCPC